MAAPNKKTPPAKSPNPVGRPVIYDENRLIEEAKALREFIAKDAGNYIGSFARQRGYHRRRIPEFVKVSREFSLAYEEAQQWQEEKFLTNGLTRTWDPGFTSKVMARVCGDEWKNSWDREEDKTEVATTVIINKIEK